MIKSHTLQALILHSAILFSTQAGAAMYEFSLEGFDSGYSISGTFTGSDTIDVNGQIDLAELTDFSMTYTNASFPGSYISEFDLSHLTAFLIQLGPLPPSGIWSIVTSANVEGDTLTAYVGKPPLSTYDSPGGPVDTDYSYQDIVVTEISNVPVPAAVWLFGSGLVVLTGVARRKKA